MGKKKEAVEPAKIVTNVEPETGGQSETLRTPKDDVMAFLSGRGIVHVDAINVPHEKDDILAIVNHLKLTGQVNADASGRIWL